MGIEALKTNVLTWGLFMSTTMKAAIHHRSNFVENLEVHRNTNFEELQNLCDITRKLILDHQAEILNVTPIDWTAPSWAGSTLFSRSSDYVDESKSTYLLRFRPILGELSDHSEANRRWENQVEEFRQSNSYRELHGIDGEPTEFEWNIYFPLTYVIGDP